MTYNTVGGITQKTQVHKKKDQEQKKTTYDLNYTYGETQYRRSPSDLKPGTGTASDIRTPDINLETGENSRAGQFANAVGRLIRNLDGLKKVYSRDISMDDNGDFRVSNQDVKLMVDPITYSNVQSLENQYNMEMMKMAMGGLSQEEWSDLPSGAKNLRVSAAGMRLGGSPMENFAAQLQKMIESGELVPNYTQEQRQTIIKSKD